MLAPSMHCTLTAHTRHASADLLPLILCMCCACSIFLVEKMTANLLYLSASTGL